MEYQDFKQDFIERTVHIVRRYKGKYEVTLLINCLTGLLLLPKEMCYSRIPDVDIQSLTADWGIRREHIKRVHCHSCGYNLKNVVRQMRNSLAHMHIKTYSENGKIIEVQFKDPGSGFVAEIPIKSLKEFVFKLAESVV